MISIVVMDRVLARVLDVGEEILGRYEIPEEVRGGQESKRRPDQNGQNPFRLVLGFTVIGLLLLVLDALAQPQELRLDQVAVDDAENRLGTGPAAEDAAAEDRQPENADEQDHQQERHQIELLHIELHEHQVQFEFIEAQ
jgi:hypothetical protein